MNRICLTTIGIFLFFFVFLSGCNDKEKNINANVNHTFEMTEIDWVELSDKRIFFGHQSVGFNIMDGITAIKNQSSINSFVVLETRDVSGFRDPLFAHSRIGKNTDPKSKITDFVNILKNGLGASVDIAFMKLCYIDVNRRTNINELFELYKTSLDSLETAFPDMKILHCTVPLTIKSKGIKGLAKIILGRDDNVYRNKYNKLIRHHYGPNEIIDIAEIEATNTDGSCNTYGCGIPGLIPGYSSDGRHLNQQGSLLVAYELLSKLMKNL